jgi:hypothetical protein
VLRGRGRGTARDSASQPRAYLGLAINLVARIDGTKMPFCQCRILLRTPASATAGPHTQVAKPPQQQQPPPSTTTFTHTADCCLGLHERLWCRHSERLRQQPAALVAGAGARSSGTCRKMQPRLPGCASCTLTTAASTALPAPGRCYVSGKCPTVAGHLCLALTPYLFLKLWGGAAMCYTVVPTGCA